MEIDISILKGMTLTEVKKVDDEQINFINDKNENFSMYHIQDCCESVTIEEIIGDLDDLVGSPILIAEERKSDVNPEGTDREFQDDSFTWTFYELATIKGSVTIRWYGESNGYYSESVAFSKSN